MFYVLGAFLPSLPGWCRDADPRIKTSPASLGPVPPADAGADVGSLRCGLDFTFELLVCERSPRAERREPMRCRAIPCRLPHAGAPSSRTRGVRLARYAIAQAVNCPPAWHASVRHQWLRSLSPRARVTHCTNVDDELTLCSPRLQAPERSVHTLGAKRVDRVHNGPR